MDSLMEIKNWLEEFQKVYKIIDLYPHNIFSTDPEKTLEKLKSEDDYKDSKVWIEIGTWSIEEMTLILVFCRDYSGVSILSNKDYDYTYYHYRYLYGKTIKNYLYKTSWDLLNDSCNRGADVCNIALRINEDDFPKFWKDFLEFCSEWKFMFQLSEDKWFKINMT